MSRSCMGRDCQTIRTAGPLLKVLDYVTAVPEVVTSQAVDYTVPNGGPSGEPSPTATPS